MVLRRLHAALAAAADSGPRDFAELLLTPGVGARTVAIARAGGRGRARRTRPLPDPARFSLAHGGKDGHPYPVPLSVYDETVRVLKRAVEQAKLGRADKLHALERLYYQARALEASANGEPLKRIVRSERARSPEWGGRSVGSAGARAASRKPAIGQQLHLPGLMRRASKAH